MDAHVGRALFNDAILGLRKAGKTILLVTHALHLLPLVDYIYTLQRGRIVEEGPYESLMASGGAFKSLMETFGGAGHGQGKSVTEPESSLRTPTAKDTETEDKAKEREANAGLMTEEERKVGAVGAGVYLTYLKGEASGG